MTYLKTKSFTFKKAHFSILFLQTIIKMAYISVNAFFLKFCDIFCPSRITWLTVNFLNRCTLLYTVNRSTLLYTVYCSTLLYTVVQVCTCVQCTLGCSNLDYFENIENVTTEMEVHLKDVAYLMKAFSFFEPFWKFSRTERLFKDLVWTRGSLSWRYEPNLGPIHPTVIFNYQHFCSTLLINK